MLRDPEGDEAKFLMGLASGSQSSPTLGRKGFDVGGHSELPWFAPEVDLEIADGPGPGEAMSERTAEQREGEDGGSLANPSGMGGRQRAAVPSPIDKVVLGAVKVPEGTGYKLRYNAVAIRCVAIPFFPV